MTLLEKAAIALIAMLIAAGGGGLLVYRMNAAKVAELEARALSAETSLKATNAALDAKVKAMAALDKRYQAKQKALNDALKANPDWAAATVPDAVWDSVFSPGQKPTP
jgi:hypothetical protein